MRFDLWIGFLAIVLLALALALGGTFLLRGEYVRTQAELREGVRSYAADLAQSLSRRYAAGAWAGLPERVDALAADVRDDKRLSTAFVWRKGKGVIWSKGDEQMVLLDMDGSFKWTNEVKRAKYPRRGLFTQGGATVAWSRMGPKDTCGYVLDPSGGEVSPLTRFVAEESLLLALCGALIASGWYLKRSADHAREESDALVEMLQQKIESEEKIHV